MHMFSSEMERRSLIYDKRPHVTSGKQKIIPSILTSLGQEVLNPALSACSFLEKRLCHRFTGNSVLTGQSALVTAREGSDLTSRMTPHLPESSQTKQHGTEDAHLKKANLHL